MLLFLSQVLKFNLTESGLLCVLPWLTMAAFANIGGWIADTLISRGLSITTVRKVTILIFSNTLMTPLLSLYDDSRPLPLYVERASTEISHILQIMQSIGFLGPAFFLTQLSNVKTPAMAVLCMACSQV